MSVWTLQQIDQARGIYARADVSIEELERYGDDVLDSVHHKAAGRMKQIGHSFAIELHPEDVQLREVERVEDKPPFTAAFRAWWEPRTTTIELRGGWMDGTLMEYRDAPRPLRVPTPPPSLVMVEPSDDPTAIEPIADTYTCAGWHEQERRWIYEPR